MEEAPYFITIRTFDPHAALLAAIHEGDIEIAQILLTRLTDVETCHIRHLASNSFQVRRPDFKLINFTGKLDVNCCNGHCLFEACKIVDESIRNDMINMLLTNGADPNIHEKVGPSPLSLAAEKGQHDLLTVLLSHGAHVEDIGNGKEFTFSPIIAAASHGHYESLVILLSHGASPDVKDKDGMTAFAIVMQNGDNHNCKGSDKAAALLLKHWASPKVKTSRPTVLWRAMQLKWTETMETLLQLGEDVDSPSWAPDSLQTPDINNMTTLCEAARSGQMYVAALLLKFGANVDGKPMKYELPCSWESLSTTPLLQAVSAGQNDMVKMLLDYGADVNAEVRSISPLACAASYGYADILNLLIDRGARLEDRLNSHFSIPHDSTTRTLLYSFSHTLFGATPLGIAVASGRPVAVSVLLSRGANAAVVLENKPLLHCAVQNYLLAKEAKEGREGKHSKSPQAKHSKLPQANHSKSIEEAPPHLLLTSIIPYWDFNPADKLLQIIQALADHGADININFQAKKNGVIKEIPLLDLLIISHDLDLIKVFLKRGVRASDALVHVSQHRDPSMLKLLLEHSKPEAVEVSTTSSESLEYIARALSQAAIELEIVKAEIILENYTEPDVRSTYWREIIYDTIKPSHRPLGAVVTTENIESMVTLLLNHGAPPDEMRSIKTGRDYGLTPLCLAAEIGSFKLVEALLEKGACVDGRDQAGVPLCRAVSNRHYEIAEFLLEKGAQVNRTEKGRSARSWLPAFEDIAEISVPQKTSKYKFWRAKEVKREKMKEDAILQAARLRQRLYSLEEGNDRNMDKLLKEKGGVTLLIPEPPVISISQRSKEGDPDTKSERRVHPLSF